MLYRFMYYAMNVMLVFFSLNVISIVMIMICKSYAYVIGFLKNILTYLLNHADFQELLSTTQPDKLHFVRVQFDTVSWQPCDDVSGSQKSNKAASKPEISHMSAGRWNKIEITTASDLIPTYEQSVQTY